MSNPLIIGLTGGIGSGKSLVSKVLRSMGVPVYDSDSAAKSLYHEDLHLQNELKVRFGEDLFENNRLNTSKLARMVFGNEDRLRALNALVHPRVKMHFQAWLDAQKQHRVVVKEAAILIESGAYKDCHSIWLVRAPEELRIKRVIQRDGASTDEVKSRLSRQWNDEKKLAFTDLVIDNDEQRLLLPQIWEALRGFKQ